MGAEWLDLAFGLHWQEQLNLPLISYFIIPRNFQPIWLDLILSSNGIEEKTIFAPEEVECYRKNGLILIEHFSLCGYENIVVDAHIFK